MVQPAKRRVPLCTAGNIGPGTMQAAERQFRNSGDQGGRQGAEGIRTFQRRAPEQTRRRGGRYRIAVSPSAVGERTTNPNSLLRHPGEQIREAVRLRQQAWEFTIGQRAGRLATPNTMNMMGGPGANQAGQEAKGQNRRHRRPGGFDDEEMMQGAMSYASMLGGATPTMRPNH